MLLEAAIVAFGKDAETLEAGNLEEVSDCLGEFHRALKDIYDYCADLPASEELGILARVVAAFQLEDPRQFASEFERSLKTFTRLQPLEFKAQLQVCKSFKIGRRQKHLPRSCKWHSGDWRTAPLRRSRWRSGASVP
ncbi:unnamed protein product [Durusdinium trenchii]|uniref:Uncharacterized protein n=1 Tax=Durusdinium trenchii TaxID=1381693 RepID=A0ABP0Q401_9DINO